MGQDLAVRSPGRHRLPSLGALEDTGHQPSALQQAVAFAGLLRARRYPARTAEAAAARGLEVVEVARRTVPFYRDLYGDRRVDRLEDVPIIDKAALVQHPLEHRLAGPVPRGSQRRRTSGTTGVPFEAIYPPAFTRWQGLLRLRSNVESRAWPWERSAGLGFHAGGDHRPNRAAALFDRFHLDIPLDEDTQVMARLVEAWRPRRLSGHPHRLLDLGRQLTDGPRPAHLVAYGETLEPVLRGALEQVYGTRPLDAYGIAETGIVAQQCLAGDLYHHHHESVLLEVLDADDLPVGPGGTGDAVVTVLHNGLMPIIRYRVSDRVTLADRPCACGWAGPALSTIIGRAADFVIDAHGVPISPERVWLFNNMSAEMILDHVRRYQIHQIASGEIVVRLELHRALPDDITQQVLDAYWAVSGGQPVSIAVLDDLGEDRPGKFKLIASDLADAAGNRIS